MKSNLKTLFWLVWIVSGMSVICSSVPCRGSSTGAGDGEAWSVGAEPVPEGRRLHHERDRKSLQEGEGDEER